MTRERWEGIERPYRPEDVERLRGSTHVEHTLARLGAERLWKRLTEAPYVAALGASTGNQAVQQVRAGLEAIYLSGWQVAADANLARQMYPDQGLYRVNSVPEVVRAINAAPLRAHQIDHAEGRHEIDWLVLIVADMEAGFGGHLNVFELTKAMIEAGAAGVHLEDQLASEKKCGHMGGKVLLPTSWAIRNLVAARRRTGSGPPPKRVWTFGGAGLGASFHWLAGFPLLLSIVVGLAWSVGTAIARARSHHAIAGHARRKDDQAPLRNPIAHLYPGRG